ncbi:thrombospondin type 3 repeat-containing protein [Actinoplanes sp. NPDC049599]|uniref:thrombospondin type 3 repeat-containing protein n=1 Tax=Actinoplanes sp. NPDC049599 TaxID=3363903 RepID=UPI0037A46CAE
MIKLRRFAVGALAAIMPILVVARPAEAAPDRDRIHTVMRLCDSTGCYVAWAVRDSDGDGACDADEIMAGTDPHDPKSRPSLTPVLELGLIRQLPSFEAGRGVFIAFPADIIAAIAKGGTDPLGAFPLHDRADSLTRAGIDGDAVKAAGINLSRDGLTMGLGEVGTPEAPAGMRIGGMDASLVGYLGAGGVTIPGAEHGGVKSVRAVGGTGSETIFNDGATRTVTSTEGGLPGDHRTSSTNPDGSPGQSTETQHQPLSKDGDVTVDSSREVAWNPDGTVDSVTYVTERTSPDGSSTRTTDAVIFERDKDGNVTSETHVTVVETEHSDGSASTGYAVEQCDAGGDNCQLVDYDYTNNSYTNPDADNTTFVSMDVVEQKLRVRGAAITVVENWAAPGNDNPQYPRDRSTIALIDDELNQTFLLVDPLRVTKAQPEIRGDLPNPYQDAGGCWPKCS